MLTKISEFIKENDNFVIIPHRNPDGDCLGSACGLLLALRSIGKSAYIKSLLKEQMQILTLTE